MTTGLVVMAYGTPASPDDVEAYYTHIRRGRPPSAEQLAELTGRYQAIGGMSPLAERTRAQVDAVAAALEAAEPGRWRVALGNKHAAPVPRGRGGDVDRRRRRGRTPDRIVGLVLAPHYSRGSVGEYHARRARPPPSAASAYAAGRSPGGPSPAWIEAQAARVRRRPHLTARRAPTVLFTAHSLPERVLAGDPYPDELRASADGRRRGRRAWTAGAGRWPGSRQGARPSRGGGPTWPT